MVGFDNIDVGEFMNPPLTTVGWSRDEHSKAIVDLLMKALKDTGRFTPAEITLSPRLIVRESCGNSL